MTAALVMAISIAAHQPAPQAPAPALASPEAAQVWTDDHPFTRLPQNLLRDLARVPRVSIMGIIGAGALTAGIASASADTPVADWVRDAGGSRTYTPIGGLIGNEWLQGGAAIAAYAIGVVQDSPEVAHIGSDLIRAQLLNGVFTAGMKAATRRTRPNGGDFSFPSGHTSATFASATVLAEHYGWKVGIPAYAVAGFIGWTRIRDHQHYLSDVLFGSAIGVAAGKSVTLGHRPGKFIITPMAVPGGGAIFLHSEF